MRRRSACAALALLACACATPDPYAGLSGAALEAAGAARFAEYRREARPVLDAARNRYVRCVADALIRALPDDPAAWEVVIFDDPLPEAFAEPGRKLGVDSRLLQVAEDQDELGAAIAHALAGVQALEGKAAEVDAAGQALAARAGFEPARGLAFWQTIGAKVVMGYAGGEPLRGWRSDPPLTRGRLRRLEAGLAQADTLYYERRSQGPKPGCGAEAPPHPLIQMN